MSIIPDQNFIAIGTDSGVLITKLKKEIPVNIKYTQHHLENERV